MQTFLSIAFYIAIIALVAVLAAGLINLVRTDENQPSRSNKLMRMRVLMQFIVIAILVALAAVMGKISFGS